MEPEILTLSLGTNLGDRKKNIDLAISLLNSEFGYSFTYVTGIIETEAIGFEGPAFLNILVQYSCALEPLAVLSICKKIEKEMGRQERIEYDSSGNRIFHDRIIDIDILKYGDYTIDTEQLKIPHPQIWTRPFIKELASELPNW